MAAGFDSLEKIYQMGEPQFNALGFGPVQSKNLAEALHISRTKPVEDWRFLAALGIPDLGTGDSRKLLRCYELRQLAGVAADQIAQIDGFGGITSLSIAQGISEVKARLLHLLDLGFNLIPTVPDSAAAAAGGPFAGKAVVFSGKMQKGSRDEMEAQAMRLGARVQSAVSRATDYLICGEKVGATKRAKAVEWGVQILSEEEYYQRLHQN